MSSKRPVIIIILSIAVLSIFCLAFFGTLFATSFVSMTEAMLEILDEPEEIVDLVDTVDEQEIEALNIRKVDGIDTTLYYKLLATDLESADLDNLRISGVTWSIPFSGSNGNWDIRAYLYAYMLAMEICLREEINPDGTAVVIQPEMLIGKWLSEDASVCIPTRSKGYLTWEEVLTEYANGMDYECIGAFAMSNRWYTAEVDYDGSLQPSSLGNKMPTGCLYISRLENPSLADEERAVIGKADAFRTGVGLYYASSYRADLKLDALTTCKREDLAAAITEGQLPEDAIHTVNDRPTAAFLPDAMYMTALSVRLAIDGRTMDQFSTAGCSYAYLSTMQDYIKLSNETNKDVVRDVCIAVAFQEFAGNAFCDGYLSIDTSDLLNSELKDAKGVYYVGNLALIKNGISPRVVQPLINSNLKEAVTLIMAGSRHVAGVVMHGSTDSIFGSFRMQDSEIGYGLTSSVNPALWKTMWNASKQFERSDIREWFKAALEKGYGANLNSSLYPSQKYFNENYQGYMTTGYSVLNVGAIMGAILPTMVNSAYDACGNEDTYQSLIGAVTGTYDGVAPTYTYLTCSGNNCWHNKLGNDTNVTVDEDKHVVTAAPIGHVTNYEYDLTDPQYDLIPLEVIDGEYPLVFKGLGFFATLAGEEANGYKFGTYNYLSETEGYHEHYNDGIDAHLLENGGYQTKGAEIRAIADGVVVDIQWFPYNMYQDDIADEIADANYKGVTGDFGCRVRLKHIASDGKIYYSEYLHMSAIAHLVLGGAVKRGTLLGLIGNTGLSTGPHLHLSMYYDYNGTTEYVGYLNILRSYLETLNGGDAILEKLYSVKSDDGKYSISKNDNSIFDNFLHGATGSFINLHDFSFTITKKEDDDKWYYDSWEYTY